MHAGHDPREIGEYPAWDFLLYMQSLPTLNAMQTPTFGMEGE